MEPKRSGAAVVVVSAAVFCPGYSEGMVDQPGSADTFLVDGKSFSRFEPRCGVFAYFGVFALGTYFGVSFYLIDLCIFFYFCFFLSYETSARRKCWLVMSWMR